MERKPSIPDEELKTVATAVLKMLSLGKALSVSFILNQLKYFGFKGYDRRKLRLIREYVNHDIDRSEIICSGNFGYKLAANDRDKEAFYENMGARAKAFFDEIHACRSKIQPVDTAPGPLFKGVNNG